MNSIQTHLKPEYNDTKGISIQNKCKKQLEINTGNIRTSALYTVDYEISPENFQKFAENCLKNKITDEVLINKVYDDNKFQSLIAVAQLPGVTDDIGVSAQTALADFLNREIDINVQHIFTQDIYYIENKLSEENLTTIAKAFLGNPLINHINVFTKENGKFDFKPYIPKVEMQTDETVELIDLDISDDELITLSEDKILALSLEEMKKIRTYFKDEKVIAERKNAGLTEKLTDVELEVFAQTWSEHCKHKEFNAEIIYENIATGEKKTINSLFKTYIKGSTDVINEHLKANDIIGL